MTLPLILNSAAVGPYAMNAYAVICPDTKQSLLVDPGAEPETLLALLAGSTPVGIVVTHGHHDHVEALDEMKARLNVPVYMHPGDSPMNLSADVWLSDGDTITVGQHPSGYPYARPHASGWSA